MQTDRRLTEAYKNARVEYFDNSSKYVIFSDCHRGIGNPSDDFTKNQITYLYALEYYLKNDFVYVEAGDGDELWETSAFYKNKNAHFEVYEALKTFYDEDRLIMLYGNHNIYLKYPRYVEKNFSTIYDIYNNEVLYLMRDLKPCEALLLKHRDTEQEILVVHGHQGDLANDQAWRLSMLSVKYFWRYLRAFGIQNPTSPVKNNNKRHKIEKAFTKWITKNKMMLVCGHTHRYKFPIGDEPPYFNTGSCVNPTTITAIEIEDGNITLVRWRVFANEDGVLRVIRKILGGPSPIEDFDIR